MPEPDTVDNPETDGLDSEVDDSRGPKNLQSSPRERQYMEGLIPLDIRVNETGQSGHVLRIESPPLNKEDW